MLSTPIGLSQRFALRAFHPRALADSFTTAVGSLVPGSSSLTIAVADLVRWRNSSRYLADLGRRIRDLPSFNVGSLGRPKVVAFPFRAQP